MRNSTGGGLLIPDLFDMEEAAADTDIGFTNVFDAVDDCGSDGPSNTIIIHLANASNRRDIRLDKVMLSEIYCQQLASLAMHLRRPFQ